MPSTTTAVFFTLALLAVLIGAKIGASALVLYFLPIALVGLGIAAFGAVVLYPVIFIAAVAYLLLR